MNHYLQLTLLHRRYGLNPSAFGLVLFFLSFLSKVAKYSFIKFQWLLRKEYSIEWPNVCKSWHCAKFQYCNISLESISEVSCKMFGQVGDKESSKASTHPHEWNYIVFVSRFSNISCDLWCLWAAACLLSLSKTVSLSWYYRTGSIHEYKCLSCYKKAIIKARWIYPIPTEDKLYTVC